MIQSLPVIHVTQYDAKQHLTDAEYHRDFHFERVEERYLVYSGLPRLTTQHTTGNNTLHHANSSNQTAVGEFSRMTLLRELNSVV